MVEDLNADIILPALRLGVLYGNTRLSDAVYDLTTYTRIVH